MNRGDILAELQSKSDGTCAICGKQLNEDNIYIDHIFPRQYGGSDRIENLRLVCPECNRSHANHPFPKESEFLQHVQKLLLHDARFQNVCMGKQLIAPDGQSINFDIVFSDINKPEQLFIVEAKAISAMTFHQIELTVRQLEYYHHAFPDAQFILAVPTLLAEEYRHYVYDSGFMLWDRETLRMGIPDMALPVCAAPDRYDELINKLKHCQPGYADWQVYQKLVGEILTALFCPPLDAISEQNSDADRTNRRDFIIPNYADSGYWPYLRYNYKADFIVVDAKNSSKEIGKDDILQVANYLNEKGAGLFGLIFARYGVSKTAKIHLRRFWESYSKMIIILSDNDVEQMLLSKQSNNDPCQLIIEKIQEFRLSIL